MQCRRCGKELPVGHRNICPFCGTKISTYITPRDPNAKAARKKSSRATLLSLLSVGLAVIVVCVVIPFLRDVNRKGMKADLEAVYTELTESELTEQEREIKRASFIAMIEKYKQAYPDDEEYIEEKNRQLNMLYGRDPDDPTQPIGGNTQEVYNASLIRDAKDSIFDILSYEMQGPDIMGDCALTITVKNCSGEKKITRVELTFMAFDSKGSPAPDAKREKSEGYVRTNKTLDPGEEDSFTYLAVWSNPAITSVKLLYLTVYYSDTDVYFPPAVCEALWG